MNLWAIPAYLVALGALAACLWPSAKRDRRRPSEEADPQPVHVRLVDAPYDWALDDDDDGDPWNRHPVPRTWPGEL